MTVIFNDIDTTSSVPANLAELDITAGAPGKGSGPRKVFICGERVSAGTSSDNEVKDTPFGSEDEARTWFGEGSNGAYQASIAFNSEGGGTVPICGMAIPDAAGTKSQGNLTVSTDATTAGQVVINIAGAVVTVPIAALAGEQDTADNIKTYFDALPASLKPPVTLTSQIAGAGPDYEVIVECNNTGVLGDGFPLKVISNTAGAQTVTADAATLGTEQAGAGITTLTTLLTAAAATRTHYVAFSDFVAGSSTTGITAMKNHIKEKANGNNMLGGFVFAGFNGTLSNATTLAAAVDSSDSERVVISAHENGQTHPMVSAVSSAMQRANNQDVSRPSNGVLHSQVLAQVVGDRWTDTECNTALAGGVTPLRCDQDDAVNVKTVRMIAIRTDVATPLDIGTIEVLDELRDRIVARQNIRFVNFKVKQDGENVYTSKCTTPSAVLAEAIGICKEMEREDKLQGIDSNIDSFNSEYVTGGKVALEIPAIVVPGLHRIMTKINLILT